MQRSPLKAFNEFISLNQGKKEDLLKKEPEFYDELIEPFILNPEKYSEHVDLLIEAKWASMLYNRIVTKIPKPLRSLIFRGSLNEEWSKSYTEKLEKLKTKLTTNLVPCELMLDFLPTRILETPEEWKNQDLLIHLLEIKTSIIPEGDLLPNGIELKIDFLDANGIQIIESFPLTDFSEEGEYQIGLSNEGKFLTKKKGSFGVGLEGASTLIKGNIDLSADTETENTKTQSSTYQFKYTSKVIKIISSAIKNKAIWKILRTLDNIPIGGLSFYLTLLIPKDIKVLKFKSYLSSDIEEFGMVNISLEENINISQSFSKDNNP